MIEGACHCGAVRWSFDGIPDSATSCNCTICRRYGTLWAYDYEGERVKASGRTSIYAWNGRTIGFHFCPECGCVAYWRACESGKDGRRRIAVNLRLASPEVVGVIAMERFDGLDSFDDLPRDGRCVSDMWF
ncbi:hypothetical protein DEA8626_01529 [Defluviimonas aquaemixtae]|uniref:CENP-V/GFA domain-containing protein n=1 Tax=Albidovulum aquaemixtae TaxID=1542388 RepID=A0A2R8B5V4_9RHOB|nr:GFA family protein [Defluviimonas aquaemixtae]SPH17999.1 hypothetical protein DEA8626_01529 [Defluviimonas aquaemixtae]